MSLLACFIKLGPREKRLCVNALVTAMPRLTEEQRQRALGRLEAGEPDRVVAHHFNCNVSTIYRLRQRYEATNSCADRPRTGRPHVTTTRQDRAIVRRHLREPFLTATETAHSTYGTHQRPISADTVRRRLSMRDLRCRRPARGPIMTRRRRQMRLQWTQQRIHWRIREWRSILFTDESRFCISTTDDRQRVWRRRLTRYAAGNLLERDPWGGPNVMV